MAETVQERINQYLEDTISAERNFEKALSTFGEAGEQTPVQSLLSSASAKAKTQHERLEALLKSRGGTPSEGKTILAEMLAFTPLSAQIGQGAAEKNTQHLMVTFAAAAAEMAMYESLATAGAEGGAKMLFRWRERCRVKSATTTRRFGAFLKQSAADSFQAELKGKVGAERCWRDIWKTQSQRRRALRRSLSASAKRWKTPRCRRCFASMRQETKEQYTLLTQRLEELGGSTSTVKSFLAHMFNFAPKIAQIGHDKYERQTQDLMMAYAVENAEVAMYESLAHAAQLAGDTATEELARQIQQQEKQTAEKVWAQVAPAARRAMQAVPEAA